MSVQPFASVAVTTYVPAVTPVMEAVVAPLLHVNEYVTVPPDAEALAPPSLPPLQLTFESTTAAATNNVG